MAFVEGLLILDSWGLTDVILPFILIFAIVFATMQKTEILGKDKKIHTVISLVLGLAVVMPHILSVNGVAQVPYDVVPAINSALPNVSLVLVGAVCFLLLIGIFGGKGSWAGNKVSGIIALLAFGIVIYIFGLSVGWFQQQSGWLRILSNPELQAVVVIIIVFALIVSYIVGDEGKDKSKVSDALGEIAKAFGGGGGGNNH